MPPFRSKDGRFSSGVHLTLEDIRRWMHRHPGGHLTLPPNGLSVGSKKGKYNWRISTSIIPEAQHYYPTSARPTVKSLLWLREYGASPSRLTQTCTFKGCLSPDHHKELIMTPDQVYKIYFTKAYAAAVSGEDFFLSFKQKGEAMAHRLRLNAYRRRGIDARELPEEWDDLSLRLEFEDGAYFLRAILPSSSFESQLAAALGLDSLEPLADEPSALDLLNEDLNKE